jgi:hypothetical protein
MAMELFCLFPLVAGIHSLQSSIPYPTVWWNPASINQGTYVSNELLDPKTTSLWCAGKEFERNQIVADRLGRNEKTKVIAKLQKAGSGPPSREPIVNEEERKAMMAHYFKRNEELKKLAEADDDDYLNSNWADSKEMKRNMQGLSHIQAPGLWFLCS